MIVVDSWLNDPKIRIKFIVKRGIDKKGLPEDRFSGEYGKFPALLGRMLLPGQEEQQAYFTRATESGLYQ